MPVRILLVDDEPLLRRAFRMLLEVSGYDVSEAGSAQEALDRALSDSPALVFLDLGLPDRSGLDIARELAGPDGGTVVVALTGRSDAEIGQACRDAGWAGHLTKPVNPRALLDGVPVWLAATGDPPGSPE